MSSTRPGYSVYINYPIRRDENEKRIAVKFVSNLLRTLPDLNDAIRMARSQRIRPKDAVYVVNQRTNSTLFSRGFSEGKEFEEFFHD